MNRIVETALGVIVGAGIFGAVLHLVGKQGALGKIPQDIAKYINEGFAVDF